MEDQQPAAGDLTADTADDATDKETTDESTRDDAVAGENVDAPTESTDTATDDGHGDKAEGDADAAERAADAEPGATAPKRRLRSRPLAGKWLAVAIALASILFVASAAFAGATMQPYLADRSTAATKMLVARTAANAITTLWTYTPENMDGLADRASAYLSGDFEAQYRKFVDAIVAPNKQAKVTNTTEVTGAAVESLDDPNAVVIVYTNTSSTSPLTKNIPSLKYLSYRLFMKRANGRWLVTRMTTVTSLDLTPHV
ncbi:MAG: Mce-associated rane protein [Mycobacterium sp.]|nr:Mce-associated rane protein [Mycobacterium sp.]